MRSEQPPVATWRASFLDGEHRPVRVEATNRSEAIEKAREKTGCMVESVTEVA